MRHPCHQTPERGQLFLAHQFALGLLQLGQRRVQGRVLCFQAQGAFVHGALQPVHALQALQRHRDVVRNHAEQGLVLGTVGVFGAVALDHDRAQRQVLLVEQRATHPVLGRAAAPEVRARLEIGGGNDQGLAVQDAQAVGDSSGEASWTGRFSGGPSSDSSTKYTKRTVPSSRSDSAT